MAKEYMRPMPTTWWLRKGTHFLFILRELTSLFVAGYAIFLLVLAARAHDTESFSSFFDALKSPWSVGLHLFALAMVLYHTVTWLNLVPKAVVLWRGEQRVSPALIVATNYVAWLVVSVVAAWIALR